MNSEHLLLVYADGASRGNPGLAASAAVIFSGPKPALQAFVNKYRSLPIAQDKVSIVRNGVVSAPTSDILSVCLWHKHTGVRTNNYAELYAFYLALHSSFVRTVLADCDVRIVLASDSKYALGCLGDWAPKWAAAGWRKSDGKTPENLDLIRPVWDILRKYPCDLQYIPAHTGHFFNELCDALCNRAISSS